MNLAKQQRTTSLQQIAGWVGFLIYACAFTPVGLGLAAVAGSLDRNHEALIESSGSGSRLVLHHQPKGANHHHGLVAQALTMFAAPSSNGQPDHVLQFGSFELAALKQHRQAPTPPSTPQPEFLKLPTELLISRNSSSPRSPTHPPPAVSAPLFNLRSTLLLI